MKNLLVILDGTAGASQAAYTAYDVAARTGARLIGAIVSLNKGDSFVEQTQREFEIGARAAGLRVRVKEVSAFSEAWSKALEIKADAVFIGQNSLGSETNLVNYLSVGICPLWIVPVQRDIHKLLVLYDSSPSAADILSQGLDLAHRWGLELTVLITSAPDVALEDLLPKGQTDDVNLKLQVMAQPNPEAVYNQIITQRTDLALIGQKDNAHLLWDFSQRANCLLAIYPALNSP